MDIETYNTINVEDRIHTNRRFGGSMDSIIKISLYTIGVIISDTTNKEKQLNRFQNNRLQ